MFHPNHFLNRYRTYHLSTLPHVHVGNVCTCVNFFMYMYNRVHIYTHVHVSDGST